MSSRREFLKLAGSAAAGAAVTLVETSPVRASGPRLNPGRMGVLLDMTLCIGCRRCEWACAKENGLPHGDLADYDDTSVFETMRRPDAVNYTVINEYEGLNGATKAFHTKVNCLHCEHPACVSACLVSALEKSPDGPVTYNRWRCVGCRYCMVACPFQIPAYEYEKALQPRVMKCTLCSHRTLDGGSPACVGICPQEAMTFGPRQELLELARERITAFPNRYEDHIYGETEVGGTSWLYLADRNFQALDLPEVPDVSPAVATENLQHGIFKGFSGPLMLFGLLGVIMKSAGVRDEDEFDDTDRKGGGGHE